MTLSVTHFASYLTTRAVAWRGVDHDASKFIKAIKGKPLNGYATVTVRGHSRRLDQSNRSAAKKWFAQMAADFLISESMNPDAKWGLVPFPSRGAVVLEDEPDSYASRELAELLATELRAKGYGKVEVADWIRWIERRPSAHDEGGTRDPNEVFPYLILQKPRRTVLEHYVLVDDVLTSGARLRSAAALLAQGKVSAWRALVAGRTVQLQPDKPFEVVTETLPDFFPVIR